jgi:hypothetical protein
MRIRRSFRRVPTDAVFRLCYFFFEEPPEELPEPIDPPREEEDSLSESSLSKRPFESLSRSLLEELPRLLSWPELCRLSKSRSPRLPLLSSGTRNLL